MKLLSTLALVAGLGVTAATQAAMYTFEFSGSAYIGNAIGAVKDNVTSGQTVTGRFVVNNTVEATTSWSIKGTIDQFSVFSRPTPEGLNNYSEGDYFDWTDNKSSGGSNFDVLTFSDFELEDKPGSLDCSVYCREVRFGGDAGGNSFYMSSGFHEGSSFEGVLASLAAKGLADADSEPRVLFRFVNNLGATPERLTGFVKIDDFHAVAPVPLPAAAWLFVSGLAGLGIIRRRKVA